MQETHFRSRGTYRLKVRRWKKVSYANENQKKAEVEILISDKIDFKIKTVTRKGLPWWYSGSGSMLPMLGAWVQSVVKELDPTCMLQLRVHMPQLRSPPATTKTRHNLIN